MIHRLEQTTPHRSKPIEATSNPSEQTTLREEGEREKYERERDEDRVERVGESEQMREKMNKIMFLFLQLCYSAILLVELHCSTIVKIKLIFYSVFTLSIPLFHSPVTFSSPLSSFFFFFFFFFSSLIQSLPLSRPSLPFSFFFLSIFPWIKGLMWWQMGLM